MNRKYIYILMQLFTSICLVSVGFASWTFVSGDSITATGNIVAQDVNNFEDYIYFDGEIQGFKFCSTGFLTEDLAKSDSGIVNINMKIKTDNCEIQYQGYNSLKIELELKYKEECEYDIFASTISISNSVHINETVEVTGIEETQEGSYKITFTLTDFLKDYRATNSFVETDDLNIKIFFNLTDEQFIAGYDYFENIDFECNVKLEGC